MLVLLLRVGARHYGLDARHVVEVVPCVPLQPAPGAPDWIAGVLQHRDGAAPVVDLSRLHTGAPAAALLSTRLVLLRRDAAHGGGLIALLAEGATQIARLDDATRAADATIALPDGGRAQLVDWTDLVPTALHDSLHGSLPASRPV